jgi:electron transport complex protein RnfB
VNSNLLADQIDAVLPQTQCGQCGYAGCKPYAIAIASGEADINQCPPGGEEGIRKLADLLGVEFKPFGEGVVLKAKAVAFIDEAICIGCTLCLQACPVDAITGAAKQMHTIIALECTGCELCLAPCPVNCISMQPIPLTMQNREKQIAADVARSRYESRLKRLEKDKAEKANRLAQREKNALASRKTESLNSAPEPEISTQALIQAALERSKLQAAAAKPQNIEQLTPAQLAQITKIEARRAAHTKCRNPEIEAPKEE